MRRHPTRGAAAVVALAVLACPGVSVAASADPGESHASVRLDPRRMVGGGSVPAHFVGFSVEWSLIERYMGPSARPAFVNLLRNLDTGSLRIGGSSQDVMQFDATATNTNEVITPEDLADIRATLEAANADGGGIPRWAVTLGTAMAPATAGRPWRGPEHAQAFVTQGVKPAFAGADEYIAAVSLGNEPDLSYGYDLPEYLGDFAAYTGADVTGPYPLVTPNTSEPISPWQSIADRSVQTRFFADWPAILDATAGPTKAKAGAFGPWAADHFYPLARTCATDPYRCPTIPALLSDERLDNFNYQVYTHADEAARHGLAYRVEELNTAAGRGAPGVSDVAASAVWALDAMFNAACPQPPHAPSVNATCGTGATGVNFHNAEVRAFFHPEEGNGYYNAVNFDPSPAMGSPAPAPEYYALLLFSRFAQGTTGLRPVPVTVNAAQGGQVKAWRVDGGASERRLFLINKGDQPTSVDVAAPGARYELDRMTPDDPSGAGRTLDAPGVRIDGRAVSADGSWPGFQPTVGTTSAGHARITLGAGEAVVLTMHGHA
ncbi:hypothetical protein [Micromonospora sp. AMSO31t]|uniref:hypothetical protein n=1 Tax=Micromonospora sp. AMSO31t TaxID=2650566 RepID=UPI00124B0055|nr:hypothetical protein [Micromonospora sp. AMSO31t]KAB1913182.1 hypothetical protein F8274_11285 [Micromonospora sp. AMSO31t]